MTIHRIEPGKRMSQAVVANGLVWLAGQIGTVGDDVSAQTQSILEGIDRLLKEVGSSKAHIVMATIWLSDMEDFAAMNAVWDAWVDPANPPGRACGEAKLATDEYRVEVMIQAVTA